MYIFGKNSTVVVCGYVCAVFLVTCSQLFFLKKVIGSQAVYSQKNENWKKQIWDFAWPLYAWGIFTWLHLASDRWALQNFASIEDVGLYAVLFQVGYSHILMLINMVMNFLGPVLYQRAGDATDLFRVISVNKIAHRLAIISLGISFFAFGILNFSHEFIFKLFVGENYLSISYLLPGIVLAGGVFGSGQVISVNIAALKMSKERIPVKIGTAFIGVLFNVVGAKLYGIEGVVFSLVGFAFLYFLWMLFLLHKLKRNFI
jgi:O-antigen/teichoic acid export membrane protein